MGWCPITRSECRDDCAWLDVRYEIDDEGVERSKVCSVVGIYATLLLALTDDTFEEG